MDVVSQLQFGVDIATSLAILGALISWLIKEKREADKRKKEQEIALTRGINNETRGIVLDRLQRLISDLTEKFFTLVEEESSMERLSGSRRSEKKFVLEEVESTVSRDPQLIVSFLESMEKFRLYLSEYYESTQKSKYVIFPVLDSLPEGRSLIIKMKDDFDQILSLYNEFTGGRLGLLKEFHRFETFLKKVDTDKLSIEEKEELVQKSGSILIDKDYWEWVESFVPEGEESRYIAGLEKGSLLSENSDLFHKVMNNFIGLAKEDPNRLYSQVIVKTLSIVGSCRKESKEILCSLSGISSHVLSREVDSSEALEDVIEKMKSEGYFDLESEIR